MPKLTNKNPVLGQKEGRAVVRYRSKTYYLKRQDGTPCKPGTKEALAAYNRLCLDLQSRPTYVTPSEESDVTVDELVAAYLTFAKARLQSDYPKRGYTGRICGIGFSRHGSHFAGDGTDS